MGLQDNLLMNSLQSELRIMRHPRTIVKTCLILTLSGSMAGLMGCASSSTTTAEQTTAAPATSAPEQSSASAAPAAQATSAVFQMHLDFGDPMQGDPADALDADAVLASLDDYDGKPVRLRGTVAEVCAKRGCWMRVAGQKESGTVFIKFTCPIQGRLIPMEAVGQPVVVEGTLRRSQVSEAVARHFAQDGGATPQEIAAIKGPQPMLRMASASARVIGLMPTTPQTP